MVTAVRTREPSNLFGMLEARRYEAGALGSGAFSAVLTCCMASMLIDRFGRVHDYLRIAVTDRCNFRCTYCMPEDGMTLGPHAELLSYEEIARLAEIFVRLGVRKIRLTGGEPLVRHRIDNLFAMLSPLGAPLGVELALSTNGALLAEKLETLWKHRFYQLNISLDTLRADRFASITGRDACEDVQRAIRAAAAYRSGHAPRRAPTLDQSFESVKINMVVMRGINDDELLDFVRFGEELSALAHNGPAVEMRYIEFMPFGGNAWSEERCVPFGEMLTRIQSEYDLRAIESNEVAPGPAKSFRVAGSNLRLGFITTVSEPFCGKCSRLRLTADGTLRTCLFGEDGVNLRDMLRHGASFETVAAAITSAVQEKWLEHPPVHELASMNTRDMIAIGG